MKKKVIYFTILVISLILLFFVSINLGSIKVSFIELFKGLLLLLADTIGRVVFSPYEIPASIIMAVIGGPSLIILLRRSSENYGS